jgi:TetR/AcrR family transcriptional regulator, cholesterol catabolism regulator
MTTKDTSRIIAAIKDRELLESRRRTVVATATELFMRRGYANVSVNEVASEANMSIGSLYKYIRTKEDILWLVVDDIYDQHEIAITRGKERSTRAREKFCNVFQEYTRSVHAARRKVLLIYREFGNLPADAQHEFIEREHGRLRTFRDIIDEGIDSGEFRCDDPTLIAVNTLMAASTWVLKGYFFAGITVDEYIAQQLALLLTSLGVP